MRDDKMQCTGKERFTSRPLADKVAKRMRHGTHTGKIVRVYRCEICRSWHIGSPSL